MRTCPSSSGISPLRDTAGNLVGSILLFRDVSPREHAEQALRQNEERFRSLAACAPYGILLMDVDGRCTFTNAACQSLCGFSLEESLGEGWVRAIHPEDRDHLTSAAVGAAREGREYAGVVRWQAPRGPVRWLELRSAPIAAAPDQRLGQVALLTDVTEQVLAREELSDRDKRLQAAAEEQRRVEEALKESRARLQSVLSEHQRAEQSLREATPALQTARTESQRFRDAHRETQTRLEAALAERQRLEQALLEVGPKLSTAETERQQAEEQWRLAEEALEQLRRQSDGRLSTATTELSKTNQELTRANAELTRANTRLQEQLQEREQTAQSLRKISRAFRPCSTTCPLPSRSRIRTVGTCLSTGRSRPCSS